MADVHMAVTRKVKLGHEVEFEERLQDFARDSMNSKGMTGLHILRPPKKSASREFGILRSFETEADADHFYASQMFTNWCDDIEPIVEGPSVRRRLNGLEAFFRNGKGLMPPRWKMALVTFLGVFPTAMFWSRLVPSFVNGANEVVTAAAINVMIVVTLTWLVMPVLTKVFHGWLHRNLK